jgi:hypothetical protein
MSRTKSNQPISDKEIEALSLKVRDLPFENKVSFFEVLKADISEEATKRKEAGIKASEILSNIHANGKS